jgi:hypothetical protein
MSTLSVNTITDASGGNTAKINTYTPTESNMMGKNRIINGDMRIDQRNAGASVTLASGTYTVDRWFGTEDSDGAMTAQQDSSAPTGFVNSIKCTTTTADGSLSGSQFVIFGQKIEGTNIADLGWGTANAKSITVSFWVRSSLTGTFGGAINNSGSSRSYPFTYSISVADTWEQKSVTIAGDTSGTWLTTTGMGLQIVFGLGVGSTLSGTAGAWNGNNNVSATGAVSVIGTLNATWYVTGVQLEVGSVATPFERRPYGTELALCQRYYYRIKADAGGQVLGSGMMQTATAGRFFIPFMVPMRTSPSALEQSGTASNYVVFNGGSAQNCDAVPTFNSATLYGAGLQATIASGGTIGYGALIRADSSAAYLGWSAEL